MRDAQDGAFAWEPCVAAAVRTAAEQASGAHDIAHIERVVRLARYLWEVGANPAADMEIVIAAAWCHDLGRLDSAPRKGKNRGKGKGKGKHGERSAAAGTAVLTRCGFPPARLDRVQECLRRHSWRSRAADTGDVPAELRLLRDADTLDAIGAIGIARAFSHAGEHGHGMGDPEDAALLVNEGEPPRTTFGHFAAKLFRIPDQLSSPPARALAAQRIAFMEQFIAQFTAERDRER